MSCSVPQEQTDSDARESARQIRKVLVGPRYHITRFLGSGGSARVYEGRDKETNNKVAIKFEDPGIWPSQLFEDYKVYDHLAGEKGFPKVFWYGDQEQSGGGNDIPTMVFELLGPSLDDLFAYCGRRFSLKTTLTLAYQLLERLETLHRKGYIHRDIKPENIMMGLGGKYITRAYLTDFGVARTFDPEIYSEPEKLEPLDREVTEKRLDRAGPTMVGTSYFASIRQHYVVGHHARDDLEGLGYMLVFFLTGHLPWEDVSFKDRDQKHRRIGRKKIRTSVEKLCRGLPKVIHTYMTYVFSIHGAVWPDYKYLRRIILDVFREKYYQMDRTYDWTLLDFVWHKGLDRVPPELATYVGPNHKGVKVPQWSKREMKRLDKRVKKLRATREDWKLEQKEDNEKTARQTLRDSPDEAPNEPTVNDKTIEAEPSKAQEMYLRIQMEADEEML